MHGARTRDGHLRRPLGVRLDEPEVIDHRMTAVAELPDDTHALGLGLGALEGDAAVRDGGLGAVESLHEIEVPPRAAKLAVGGCLKPELLLPPDDLLDLLVLDRLELVGGDLALLALRPSLLDGDSAQQAADVVSTEGRLRSLHLTILPVSIRPCAE